MKCIRGICLLMITFASSLVPGQHRQNAGPDLDSTGLVLDLKVFGTLALVVFMKRKSNRLILKKKISRWQQMHEN